MWCILRLATTEVKSESTCEISLFWKLVNEVLSQITGRDYQFNPHPIIVDENSANILAIKQVFELDFVTLKVVSYQKHYKYDINKASFRKGVSSRDEFRNIC